jgi:D-alanyl-D-alanine carboxypeptidase
MKFLKNTAILFCFLFYSGLNAQTVSPELTTLLNQTLDSMRAVLNVKSLSAAMQFPDSAVWAHAKGISSVFPNVSVTTDDVYLIGSVTKTITSACILQLDDENVLSINDSLHEWLDTIPYINPNITIKQLLRHQSGIYDVLYHPDCQAAFIANQGYVWDAEDLVNQFIGPPNFAPGAGWSYSNTNYFLLGMIIEKATGHPFYEELRSRFFTPLAMNTIAIPAFEPLTSPVAHVWLDINGDNIADDAHNFYMNYLALNSAAGAAGGYFATPSDITRWMRTYMRGDLLSAAMKAEAQTTVTAPGIPGGTYGLGLMKKSFLGFQAYGHGGDLAYHASSWYFPMKDVSITVFTNDSKNDSWALVPVISALLKTYNTWCALTATHAPDESAAAIAAFPNPFEKDLTIAIHLPEAATRVSMILTNTLGATVQTINRQHLSQGEHWITWQLPDHLAPGVYFVNTLVDGQTAQTIRVIKQE